MQFQQTHITTDYISVWLRENQEKGLGMFWCPVCRNGICQFQGDLVTIHPGLTESKLPILVQCRQCKTKYLFHSIVRKEV